MRKGNSYYRVERYNWLKIAIVWASIIGICYYGYISVQCIKHYQGLMNNRSTTISMMGGIND
jgi:hypothetical protein